MVVRPVEDPLGLARRYLDGGQPQRALATLEAAPELADDPEFSSLRAEALYDLDEYDAVVEAALTGLAAEPDHPILLDFLALAESERGREKQALAAIDTALELYPDFADFHAHRALILARSKRRFRLKTFRPARAAIDEALWLDPTSATVRTIRAQIAAMSGDRRAPEYAVELLAENPDDASAHAIAGAAFSNTARPETFKHFEEAARLNPSDEALAHTGRYFRELRRPFFAPMVYFERVTRGRVQFAWVLIVIVGFGLGQPVVSALVFLFWVYMWTVRFYLRRRVGKEPK